MSERRVFVQRPVASGGQYLPDAAGIRYIARVLRATSGERFWGFDASGMGYCLEWLSEKDGFKVLETIPPSGKEAFALSLAQGIPKGPKFESVLRQCTEAGVRSFFPLLTDRTVVRLEPEEREGKRERWERILQEACRQSGRDDVPELSSPLPWDEALEVFASFDLVVMLYEGDGAPLRRVLETNPGARRVLLLVGPEGGWSPREVEQALERGAKVAHLPTPILRTETAPLAVVAMVRYHFS
jgi:16S rRNA (uracil1498-N3)-methyltransferase